MAKYPIVVVKENPGTQEIAGKLTITVKWRDDETAKVNEAMFKLPDVVGKLSGRAELNGKPVEADNGEFRLELGSTDYPSEEDSYAQP